MELSETIVRSVAAYFVLLFSLSWHEAAHALAALRMDDDTAARQGRVSLNPLVHIDPVGTVLVPALQMLFTGLPFLAWAKPTPVLPQRFREYRRGHVLVAGAGPASNILLAGACVLLLAVAVKAGVLSQSNPLGLLLTMGVQLNVILAVFNMLPIPPLDGSKIASFALPESLGRAYDRLVEPIGMWLLLIVVATPIAGLVINPVLGLTGTVLRFILNTL